MAIANSYASQELQFALRVAAPAQGIVITLPDGSRIESGGKIEKGQFVICKGGCAWLADNVRKATAQLDMDRAAVLPHGESRIRVQFDGTKPGVKVNFELAVWSFGKSERVGN